MPKTIVTETTVYTLEELSESAKEKAHGDWLNCSDLWHWQGEWEDSLNAFCAIAPVKWSEYNLDWGSISYRWKEDESLAELSGVRAWKWLLNNGWFDLAERNARGECTLTGYCGDCDLFDPIHKVRDNPNKVPSLKQVFYECLQYWVYAARRDYEYCASMESFAETCEANEWLFTEGGKFHG